MARSRRSKARTGQLRLILADDHDAVRASLRRLLSGQRNLTVVAEASDGNEALCLFEALRPDLMLVDVNMPGVDGLALTRAVKMRSPDTGVVVITMDASPRACLEAIKAGADAYVLKGTVRAALLTVVRQVLQREPQLQVGLAQHLVALIDGSTDGWRTC